MIVKETSEKMRAQRLRGRIECAPPGTNWLGMKRNTENEQINADSSFLIQLLPYVQFVVRRRSENRSNRNE